MKKILFILLMFSMVGCGNMSPRSDPELRQKIDNNNGRIDEIESNQNSIKSELESVQKGLINNANSNSGIQILSGSGGLFLGLIGLLSIFTVTMHYRTKAINAELAADIMAENIVSVNDPNLTENVFKAAMFSGAEEKVLELVKKHQDLTKDNISINC
jgi:hypothetical protein